MSKLDPIKPLTGAEHFALAHQLVVRANGMDLAQAATQIAVAQVHATLALAAATDPSVANPNHHRDQAAMGPL